MDRSLVVVCCAQYSSQCPWHVAPEMADCYLVYFSEGLCLFGVSACLVGGLWGGDGGGAAVDQGGQLVEADDAEEVA